MRGEREAYPLATKHSSSHFFCLSGAAPGRCEAASRHDHWKTPLVMAPRYRIGNLDLAVLSDGDYYYDAGAVFGIVPKVMWQRFAGDLDDQHRMTLSLNSLLLRSQGRLILIE